MVPMQVEDLQRSDWRGTGSVAGHTPHRTSHAAPWRRPSSTRHRGCSGGSQGGPHVGSMTTTAAGAGAAAGGTPPPLPLPPAPAPLVLLVALAVVLMLLAAPCVAPAPPSMLMLYPGGCRPRRSASSCRVSRTSSSLAMLRVEPGGWEGGGRRSHVISVTSVTSG